MGTNKFLKKLFCISFVVLGSLSCGKHIPDEYPDANSCEKYAGKYLMYDSEGDSSYEMLIECKPLEEDYTNSLDSVFFYNFANRFSYGYNADAGGDINGTIIQPLIDKSGNSWTFSSVHGSDYENKINVLIGDSIFLRFNIDNTAYWVDDGIPYQNIISVHKGVKIH